MSEMNRDQRQQSQSSRGQSNQGMGSNQDMPRGRTQQQSGQDWDGTDRRMGRERRQQSSRAGAGDVMTMNEGSSR